MSHQIVVLGAGPAGAAVALGLKRLGYTVTVVSEWRRFSAVEGVSQRVLDGLRHAGLNQALASAAPASPRYVQWNGERHAPNIEFLLDRRVFDAAIRHDLISAGVRVIEARVRRLDSADAGHQIQLESDSGPSTLIADFLVEARGRQAPMSGKGLRGQETISLLNSWQQAPGTVCSAVESLTNGWAWMARLSDGRCFWQYTLDAHDRSLPEKSQLPVFCAHQRQASALVNRLFGTAAHTTAAVHARSSTATLCTQASGQNWLRVGDAAMAVDPLSGNGIFQSLSSSLQAPVVINSILKHPDRAELAKRFHQKRVEQLFMRFARIGRDFYALETQWSTNDFWQQRCTWPDTRPMHLPADFTRLRISREPVINNDLIEEVEVVVTEDQPLGIWHLQGIKLVPVVRTLQSAGLTEAIAGLEPSQQKSICAWLKSQGYRPN